MLSVDTSQSQDSNYEEEVNVFIPNYINTSTNRDKE